LFMYFFTFSLEETSRNSSMLLSQHTIKILSSLNNPRNLCNLLPIAKETHKFVSITNLINFGILNIFAVSYRINFFLYLFIRKRHVIWASLRIPIKVSKIIRFSLFPCGFQILANFRFCNSSFHNYKYRKKKLLVAAG